MGPPGLWGAGTGLEEWGLELGSCIGAPYAFNGLSHGTMKVSQPSRRVPGQQMTGVGA